MFVLTRRQGETIVINGDIQVSIIALKGGKVRIGIEAPEWVTVDRQEVHQRRAEFTDASENLIEGASL